MRLGLFIPCYMDQLYPRAAHATLRLLERLGHEVECPDTPACCGQPMSNSGHAALGEDFVDAFARRYAGYERVVSPSASCLLHLKEGLEARGHPLAHHAHELCEFLHDVERVEAFDAAFPHRVGLHQGCHGLRGLGLGRPSERMEPHFSKPERLLKRVRGLELVELDRPDECCGFGGSFAVFESDVSAAMGSDRVADHAGHGAEFITSTDMSCLMHLGGLAARSHPRIKVLHIAEILAGEV
ncbi:MAG TPA: Fe-S oxidoreductase [Verrucomicrobiales bacterium]|nr:Fe-S oxidoreductase [Verrucomicrobiales bacterium]HRJ11211.1 (Fe-S)-binding protein [Prosthecobacter sp.]HRK17118.1 (Fe-S)-binding protein [Prosthecobacter sp.]